MTTTCERCCTDDVRCVLTLKPPAGAEAVGPFTARLCEACVVEMLHLLTIRLEEVK